MSGIFFSGPPHRILGAWRDGRVRIVWLHKLPLRLRSLFKRGRVEQELSDELRFHLEKLIEENVAKGVTPEEARYAALRELGGVEQIKEECRDMRRVNWIENFLQDVRYGLQMLAKNPGFTAVGDRRQSRLRNGLVMAELALSVVLMVTAGLSLCSSICLGQVDPTWVHRSLPDIAEKTVDLSTGTCHYQPIFGEGDSVPRIVRSVARFGEVKVDPQGACRPVAYAREEQIYVILEGSGVLQYGGERVPVRKNDFMYLPPGITHTISGSADQACRLVVMGFKIPPGITLEPPPRLLLANMDEVKEQTVEGHPSSVLYKLLVGDRKSTRDKIAAGYVVTSLFLMDFAPGGTNSPHHHDTAEEIYLVLDGHGKIVAGGGMDGIEGFHAANAGDAYFFRLNCTVGFYNSPEPGAKAHILAVRSQFPFHNGGD